MRLTLLLLLLFLFPVRMTDPRRRRVGCEQDHTAVTSRASQSELPLTFGLGKPEAGKTVSIEIVWPSGQKEALSKIKENQFVTVKAGPGIILAAPSCLENRPVVATRRCAGIRN